MRAQVAYGDDIQAWLKANFPEFGAHPAAISAVVRLHFLFGRGCLTVSEHGGQIRESVARWERRWGECP